MKKALPANIKISKDAKETVQECISEFISFITGDDLLWAMTTLGFEEYVEPLKVYLLRFSDMEGEICCVLFGTGTGILVINDEFASLETDINELGEFEEDIWSPAISPIQSKCEDKSDDCNFVYISEILRASNYLLEDYDIFQLLEKQQYLIGNNTSRVSSLERKLIFDTVSEILDRDRKMPPWKDLAGDAISRWGDCPVEMSEATLDIERMIFKDLVGETIGDLVAFAENRKSSARRKLDGGEKIESKKHKKKKKKKKKEDKGQKNKRFSSKDIADAIVKRPKKKLKL
ncbi:unnamed protein product [Camellia sinensis]